MLGGIHEKFNSTPKSRFFFLHHGWPKRYDIEFHLKLPILHPFYYCLRVSGAVKHFVFKSYTLSNIRLFPSAAKQSYALTFYEEKGLLGCFLSISRCVHGRGPTLRTRDPKFISQTLWDADSFLSCVLKKPHTTLFLIPCVQNPKCIRTPKNCFSTTYTI